MSDKYSKITVEANGAIWAKNLRSNTKPRPNIPKLKKEINKVLCRFPLKKYVIGRHLGLHDVSSNDRKERARKICCELKELYG